MDTDYSYVIKIGAIVGVIIALISSFNITLHTRDFTYQSLSSIKPLFYLFLLLIDLLFLIILVGLGYNVVHHYRNFIHSYKDAIVLSAMAGGIAGIINGTVQFILRSVIPSIINYINGNFTGNDAILIIFTLIDIAVYVFIGNIILSAIGGLIYIFKNKNIIN